MNRADKFEPVSKFLDLCETEQAKYDEFCQILNQRYRRHFARNAPVRPDNPLWHNRTLLRKMIAKGVDMIFCGDTMLVDPSKLDALSTASLVGDLRPDECGPSSYNGQTWIRLWWD